jgi:hypothetical protein
MSAASLFTKPWFVASIVFGCFAIITPKILIPLFKQLFGYTSDTNDRRSPQQQQPVHYRSNNNMPRSSFAASNQQQDQQGSSTSRSILVFILPIYAVGIAVYMIYTLFKVYNKKELKTTTTDDNLDDEALNNIKWDPLNKRFIAKNDGVDEYANLDDDYVEFLKAKRLKETTTTKVDGDLNGVLNVMKLSLNSINTKLVEAERKGGPMDDVDLQNLRLQLANTELQMVKILSAIDTLAKSPDNDEFDYADRKMMTVKKNNNQSSSNLSSSLESDSETNLKMCRRRRNRKLNKKNKVNKLRLKKNDSDSSDEINNDGKKLIVKLKKDGSSSSCDENNEI